MIQLVTLKYVANFSETGKEEGFKRKVIDILFWHIIQGLPSSAMH